MKLPVSTWPMAASPRSFSLFSLLSHWLYGSIAPKRATMTSP